MRNVMIIVLSLSLAPSISLGAPVDCVALAAGVRARQVPLTPSVRDSLAQCQHVESARMAAEYKAAAQAKAEERAARNAARHAEKVQAKEDAAAAKKEAEEDIARKEREEANRCQADPECVRGVLRDNICGYRERVQEILKNIATEKRGARRVGVINLGALQAWKEELVYEEDNLKGAMAEWKGYTHKAFKGSCK